MAFFVADDPTPQQNGDLAVRSDKGGRLVALVYAMGISSDTRRYADIIAAALNTALSPGHTDLMVAPEDIDVENDAYWATPV